MTQTEKKRTAFFPVKAHAKDPNAKPPWVSAKFTEWNLRRFGFVNFLAGKGDTHRIATCFVHAKALCDHLYSLAADSIKLDEDENPQRYDKHTAPLSRTTVYIQPSEEQRNRFRTAVAVCVDCYKSDQERAEDRALTERVWEFLEGERFGAELLGNNRYPVICRRSLQESNPNVFVTELVELGKDLLRSLTTPENSPTRTVFLNQLYTVYDRAVRRHE